MTDWDAEDFDIDNLKYDEDKNIAAAEIQDKVKEIAQEQNQKVEEIKPKPSSEKTTQQKKKSQQINDKMDKIKKKYEEDPFGGLVNATKKPTYQDKKRAEEISKMQDAKIMADLFVPENDEETKKNMEQAQKNVEEALKNLENIPLTQEKDFELFAKAFALFLSEPTNKNNAAKVIEQLLNELYESLNSEQYSKLLSKVKILQTLVQKEEKTKNLKKSTKKQNTLNTGKQDKKLILGDQVHEEEEQDVF